MKKKRNDQGFGQHCSHFLVAWLEEAASEAHQVEVPAGGGW